ncbi:MAG: alkene reductase [Deltaproteobacteria bacterium]|nr:alkene reductase [Deltaproteobacteria bacterium]MBU48584.1 alkene reductase [Deltaproteobacteria bacterium]
MSNALFSEYTLGSLTLPNRIIMAPMTRCRAIGNVPNELMAEYYAMRADAGLLITEGTAPCPNGLGYARIPGIYTDEQIEGWKKVTDTVHQRGGRIFMQLLHTGRVGHPLNMPKGARIVAPSAITAPGEMFTDQEGPQPHPIPTEMSIDDIQEAKHSFVQAAKNAITAGCDGIEIHGANGYLVDQFINPGSNKRTDIYGGSIENRCRFALEVAEAIAKEIGPERTGIRLSPYGVYGGMEMFEEMDATFLHLASELATYNLAFIHLVDHSAMGAPDVPNALKASIKQAFSGTLIECGGMDTAAAEKILGDEKRADLIGFGRAFISNPDLVERLKHQYPLAKAHSATFYTPGKEGYLDYPLYTEEH